MNNSMYFENEIVKYLEPQNKNNLDLFLCQCGTESCSPNHSFGPAVRDHYLIHYVIDGEGSYSVNNKTYKLKKNQGFLIFPQTIAYYEADKENPWTYAWIGFNGLKAEYYLDLCNLSESNLIFTLEEDTLSTCIEKILSIDRSSIASELKTQSLLYMFLSSLSEINHSKTRANSQNNTELYVEKSIDFIVSNYSNNIKISDIANFIGINRSYLSSIFKEKIKVSPQEFLLNFRIKKACVLLENKSLAIGDVSRSVGYADQLIFSKIFKKVKGVSPKEYRKSL